MVAIHAPGTVAWQSQWLRGAAAPVMSWITRPQSQDAAAGVVILPPLAYEYWTSYATLRTLAWRLSEAGLRVIRFDYEGTGDSGGDPWQPGQLAAWQADVSAAVAELRAQGCRTVLLAGLRFGATLALVTAADVGADGVAAIAPVQGGARYAKELTLLGQKVPAGDAREGADGALISGGVPFTRETLAALRTLTLTDLTNPPAPRVLVADRADGGDSSPLVARLQSLGVTVDHRVGTDLASTLDVTTERAVVPAALVGEVVSWLTGVVGQDSHRRAEAGLVAAAPADGTATELAWQTGHVREQAVVLAGKRLVGVLGGPVGAPNPDTVVVFLNSGAEHHVGPGRAWVEFARHLNLAGVATLRLDFSGWGESVFGAEPPARPYAATGVEDTWAVAASLRERGYRRVLVVGLCSSAYVALQAGLGSGIDGVYALNPQLYWRPGDPDQMTVAEALVWRADRIRREVLGRRYRLWSLLDVVGMRSASGRWLSALRRRDSPIRLVFAAGDIGLNHLNDRSSRRLARALAGGSVALGVIPDVDHQMHQEWRRRSIAEDLTDWVRTCQDVAAPAPGAVVHAGD